MENKIRILVVGCGGMGRSHSRAYRDMENFEIAGLVSRRPESREILAEELGLECPLFSDYFQALDQLNPDAVSINTLTDTHYAFTKAALEQGCHVFLEKPAAETVEEAEELIRLAKEKNRVLLVGYILQHHPAWQNFTEAARDLGRPLVMRMNLNQQSSGLGWEKHKSKLQSLSPLVECGVHYVDVMCRMIDALPLRVSAVEARLTSEIPESSHNYGHMQIEFTDGSIGWYESGWGPMMSRNAFFIKDVCGPKGSVSLVASPDRKPYQSHSLEDHTRTDRLVFHNSTMGKEGNFAVPDHNRDFDKDLNPGHDSLCALEQEFFLLAINEKTDLEDHHLSVLNSMKIVLAAEESARSGKTIQIR